MATFLTDNSVRQEESGGNQVRLRRQHVGQLVLPVHKLLPLHSGIL